MTQLGLVIWSRCTSSRDLRHSLFLIVVGNRLKEELSPTP